MQVQKSKPGYKKVKSLFGKYEEIPENWEIKKFYELFEFLRTGTNSRSDLEKRGDIQYIHYGDIHTKWKLILDCDVEEIPWIAKTKVEKLPLLKEGDIIIADASEDYQGSGTSILLKNVNKKKIVSGLHTIVLRSKNENISLDFRAYLTSIKFIKKQIIAYVTGISVYGLSKNNLQKVKILPPSFQEQKKIASILSNVDFLINQRQKAIEQTKKIKKGLMQQLLTKGINHKKFKNVKWLFGKKIMIPEEWGFVQLKTLCRVVRGGSPRPARDPKYFGGNIPWITVGELTKDSNMILNSVSGWLTAEGKKHSRYLDKNTLVIANSGATLGVPKILGLSGCANDGVAAFLELKEELQTEFLYYRLFTLIQFFRTINQGMGQPNLNTDLLGNLKIMIPSKKEQQKITSILSEVDSRIKHLEYRKSNLQTLQKGLMQKLLTGQIRV